MMWIERVLSEKIEKGIASRPVILLTGARQTGKTSLLRKIAEKAEYISFDRLLIADEAEKNPSRFLSKLKDQVILDEIQYTPSLFRELKILIDENRQLYGKWLLTGSQKFQLMKKVSESLAGRVGIFMLETLSLKELRDSGFFDKDTLYSFICKGGFPELWSTPNIDVPDYFEDYIQTYLEKDLKEIVNVGNLRDFRKMLQICALRTGQLINYSEIAKEVGVSLKTIQVWINALEISGVVYLLSPYFANIGKRLIKAPKLFFADNGLLAYLLGVNMENYDSNIYKGAIWENLIFSELIKNPRVIPGRNLFFYRDQNGVEIDFIYNNKEEIYLIEAKAAEKVNEKKINFRKVAPLLKNKKVNCILACNMNEEKIISLKSYDIINPLFSQILSD
ncbi:MAG: ATP-binding protein [Verrucomicrobiota bacterium]|nr:ATP-binding protein [Verrucomicrobiota bacterium]